MASKTREEGTLARYILGGLSERERERLEGEYFEDDETFEQMLIAEEELIDAYVRRELSTEERARFEEHVLSSPQGRERVQFARVLAGAVSDARIAGTTSEEAPSAVPRPRPAFLAALRAHGAALRLAFAVAALAAAVGLSWLLVERARMRDELQQLRRERATLSERTQEMEQRAAAERARSEGLLAQLEGERARPTPTGGGQEEDAAVRQERPSPGKGGRQQQPRPSVISFVLTPGLVRGGGGDAATLQVPRGASSIALRLNVEMDTYASYRAVIETPGGLHVWSANLIKPRRPTGTHGTIALPALPTRDLPPGDYILLLSGKRPDGEFEGVADYSFRVSKK